MTKKAKDLVAIVDAECLKHPMAYKVLSEGFGNGRGLVVVPEKARKALEHGGRKGNQGALAARMALGVIQKLIASGVAVLRGENSDPPLMDLISAVAARFSIEKEIVVITQDRNISARSLDAAINAGGTIRTVRIASGGRLAAWEPGADLDALGAGPALFSKPSGTTLADCLPPHDPPSRSPFASRVLGGFAVMDKPLPDNGELLRVAEIPDEGSVIVTDSFGTLTLQKKLGIGGEGAVFTAGPSLAAKIYKRDRLTVSRLAKISLMVSRDPGLAGVCWPAARAWNRKEEFVGYVMRKAEGVHLQRSVFVKPLLEKRFPSWDRRHLVNAALSFLYKVRELHAMNVLLGDINPMNIPYASILRMS